MESVAVPSGVRHLRLDTHFLLAPALRHLRASFAGESVPSWALWLVASEGFAAWVRYVEHALGEHLDDRYRAREIMTAACGEMFRRRALVLIPPLGKALANGSPTDMRAIFEALSPGPIATSIRWSLESITKESPGIAASVRAWRLVHNVDTKARWLEVSHHLGELAIVLTQLLPKQNVPRAIGWLGDVCHAFGKEVAELMVSLFRMPLTMESGIETLRMGELLFQVNPEHSSGVDSEKNTGFIDGNACLWYKRPGWGPIHCGVLGRFQAGISEVFGHTYSLTKTIPKHGGDTCRITLNPIQLRAGAERKKSVAKTEAPAWQPPIKMNGRQRHLETLAAIALGKDPIAGYFGPESLMWQNIRESVVLLGGGRAALMQLAHPFVAHAVRDHSVVHEDMLGRFMRTMMSAYTVVFGSIAEVGVTSERVYGIHAAIAGLLDDVPGQDVRRYHALDPEAVFWVGATLFDTAIMVFERMVRPLEMAERDCLVREATSFWVAFGLPPETCPTTWADLHGYVERRVETLAPLVGDTARDQAALLFKPQVPFVQPIFDQLRLITAEMLPASLRQAFDMELNPQEHFVARSWIFAAERLTPWLPSPIRYVPAYHQAKWRMRRAVS